MKNDNNIDIVDGDGGQCAAPFDIGEAYKVILDRIVRLIGDEAYEDEAGVPHAHPNYEALPDLVESRMRDLEFWKEKAVGLQGEWELAVKKLEELEQDNSDLRWELADAERKLGQGKPVAPTKENSSDNVSRPEWYL